MTTNLTEMQRRALMAVCLQPGGNPEFLALGCGTSAQGFGKALSALSKLGLVYKSRHDQTWTAHPTDTGRMLGTTLTEAERANLPQDLALLREMDRRGSIARSLLDTEERQRVRRLTQEGYVEAVETRDGSRAYTLTPEGEEFVEMCEMKNSREGV